MYWTIAFYTFLGWLIMHLRNIQRFNKSTPGISYGQTLKLYVIGDVSAFIISIIGLIVMINALNLGLANWILTDLLKIPLQIQDANQLRLLGFGGGTYLQTILSMFDKSTKEKVSETIEKKP